MSRGGTVNNLISYNYLKVYNNLVSHNAHPSLDLYEGNVTPLFQADGYHGSSSALTWYRNWIRARPGMPVSLGFNRFNRQMGVVGNVLGEDGVAAGPISYGNPFMGTGAYVGSAQPTKGDFWGDWKITGTLTTRISDTVGVFTVSGGNWYVGYHPTTGGAIQPFIHWNNRANRIGGYNETSTVTNVNGSLITIQVLGQMMPAAGTAVEIFPAAAGFYEQDLDVEASSFKVANYASSATGNGSVQNSTADILPGSLAYAAKPAWFGDLAWPPVDPFAPKFSPEIIPAGYRFKYGKDPLGIITNPVIRPSSVTGIRQVK